MEPQPQPPVRTAAWNTLGIFVTRLVSLPLGLLSSVIIARALGDSLRGSYGYLLLFNSLWLPIASLGIGGAVIYLVSSKRFTPPEIIFTALTLGCLQGLAVALLAGLLWFVGWSGQIAARIPSPLVIAALTALPIQGMYLMGTRVLAADSRFALGNRFALAALAVPCALQLLVFVVWPGIGNGFPPPHEGWTLAAASGIYLFTHVLLGLILCVILVRRYRPQWGWNREFFRSSADYGLRVWWGDITTRLNLRGDQWIMGYFVTDSQFGLYAIAVTISEMLWNIPDSLNYVLFNKIAAESQPQIRAEMTERVHRVLWAAMIALAVALGLSAPWLIRLLYREEYLPAAEPLIWLLPGTVFLTTTKILTKYFGGSGKPELSSIITISGTVIGLTACWAVFQFAPQWGIMGAAAASSLGYLTTAVMSIAVYWREAHFHRPHLFFPERGDARWFLAQVRGFRGKPRGRTVPQAAASAPDEESGPPN